MSESNVNDYLRTNRDHWDELTSVHVASEFYEPAIGKWSVAVAAPYALIVPVYFMKLALNFYKRLASNLLKN